VEDLSLGHNETFYATVTARNHGHLQLTCGLVSNGVLVDLTDPNATLAWAKDGSSPPTDMQFSSSPASVEGYYGGFFDPESHIVSYTVSVTNDGGQTLQVRISTREHANCF